MFPNCYYFSKLDKKSCPSLTKDSFLILMKNYFNNLSDSSIILFAYFFLSLFNMALFTNKPIPIITRPQNPTIIPNTYFEKLNTKLSPVPKTKTPIIPTKIDANVAVLVM